MHTQSGMREFGRKLEKSEMERLKGVMVAFKHVEGDRKRIVKCTEEMGRTRERHIGRR